MLSPAAALAEHRRTLHAGQPAMTAHDPALDAITELRAKAKIE